MFEEDELEPLFPVDEEDGVSLEELAILEDERIENAADEEDGADASAEDAASGARESDGAGEPPDASVFPRSIVVPDDFETLAEALEFVAPSGVILLKKRDKPYELGQSRRLTDADRRGALASSFRAPRGCGSTIPTRTGRSSLRTLRFARNRAASPDFNSARARRSPRARLNFTTARFTAIARRISGRSRSNLLSGRLSASIVCSPNLGARRSI